MAKQERVPQGGAPGPSGGPDWNLDDLHFDSDGHLRIKHAGLADAIERAMERGKAASPNGKRRLWMHRIKPRSKREVIDEGKSGGGAGTGGKDPGAGVVVNMMCPCAPEP